MKKYAISKEFFPWNLFTPPISEKFLAMSVPHMKPPKSLSRDAELDVTTHKVTSYDGEKITCFLLSPKNLPAKAPCLIYLHGGGFVLEAAGYHYDNAMRYAKEVGCKVVFPCTVWHLRIPTLCSLRTAMPLFAGLMTTRKNWASTSSALASAATAQAPLWRWACA